MEDTIITLAIALILYSLYSFVSINISFAKNDLVKPKVKDTGNNYLLGIQTIQYEHNNTAGALLTNDPAVVIFKDIERGDYSQSVWLIVNYHGKVSQYSDLTVAQNHFKVSDLGIVEVTLSRDRIQFKDILPKGRSLHELVKLRFQFGLGK